MRYTLSTPGSAPGIALAIAPAITLALTLAAGPALGSAPASTTAGFESLPLPGPQSHYNGSDDAGSFTDHGIVFHNQYNDTYKNWSGFAYSNETDNTTAGFTNQYSAYPGAAATGSKFAVGYGGEDAKITLPVATTVQSAQLTNTTYTALNMRDGNQFSKPFGGQSGDDPDYLKLTIFGYGQGGAKTGSVDFYLADYRFDDNAKDYIVRDWQSVDLSSLGDDVKTLGFGFTGSDVGDYGLNTPTYFALDNLRVAAVPEPATASLLGLAGAALLVGRRRRGAAPRR